MKNPAHPLWRAVRRITHHHSPFTLHLCLVLLLACTSACQRAPSSATSAFQLKTTTLKVGGKPLEVEIADTAETMQIGLMYRQTMPEEHGMIFVFPELRQASFWMHNTNLPLDIAYLDSTGKVREIHAAAPHDDTPIPSATADMAYALETNQGWFTRHGLAIGVQVEGLPKPGF